jgi:signal transduction histidine kinase
VTGSAGRARFWTRVGAGLLIVLWAAAAVPLSLDAGRVLRAHTVTRLLGAPADEVVVQVQEERRLSAGFLADVVDRDALAAQRARTDRAAERLRSALDGPARRTAVGDGAARRSDALLRLLDGRAALRAAVDRRTGGAADGYTATVSAALDGAPWLWPDAGTRTGSALLAVGRAREALSRQDALLVAGAERAPRTRVAELVLTRRVLLAEASGRLPEASRPAFAALAAHPATARLHELEDALLGGAARTGREDGATGPGGSADGADSAGGRAVDAGGRDEGAADREQGAAGREEGSAGRADTPGAWAAALDDYRTRLRQAEVDAVAAAGGDATPGAVVTVAAAGLLAGLGLVAVVAALVALRRFVRRPGGPAPVAAPAAAGPDPDGHLQRLLLEQNRRNQALLHRMLRQLDGLQRRVADDATLGELFRIDHLASRVRRNVEKTVALTGGTPGRRWTRPVALVEVVRAAAAAVPGFERVSTARVEPVALTGPAVTDVLHLLSELIENAAVFSPAETRVGVDGRWDDDGYVLTVADHGPGMTEDDLAIAADVLASATPPATDAWDGLWAAGRLAGRAGATVTLRNGGEGGLRAEVRLPAALLMAPEEDPGDRAPAAAGVGGDE